MALKDAAGQEKVADFLISSIKNNRCSHAYLFIGPQGSGKRRTAKNFAKALNCQSKGPDSCDRCESCNKIDNGNHPDVVWISSEGEIIKIGEIRNLIAQINLKPYEGKCKVYIILDAHRLNEEASNALLKTLEEPPANSVIILITSNPARLLPTIQSRCEKLKFKNPAKEFVIESLAKKYSLTQGSARYIAYLEGGQDKREAFLGCGEPLTFKNEVIDTFLERKLDWGLIDESIEKQEATLFVLASLYRDLVALKADIDGRSLINFDRFDKLLELSQNYSFDTLQGILRDIERTRVLIKENVNTKLAIANLRGQIL